MGEPTVHSLTEATYEVRDQLKDLNVTMKAVLVEMKMIRSAVNKVSAV